MTREECLCNPLGIKHEPGVTWAGQSPDQTDPIFVKYIAPEYGVRAGVKTLESYLTRDGIDTISGAIYRWSPPEENDTVAYIAEVCDEMKCDKDTPLNPKSLPMLRAMIRHENGLPALTIYTDAVIEKGISLV